MNRYILTDLIDLHSLQQVQDSFSQYTGLAAIITDANGIAITKASGFTPFCSGLIRKSPLGRSRCEKCDKNGALSSLKISGTSVYTCHAGLIEFSAPIMVDGEFLGAFVGGQIFPEEPDLTLMENTAKDLHIQWEEYFIQAQQTNCRTNEQVRKAAAFVQEIATVLSVSALKNYNNQLRNIHLEQLSRSQFLYTNQLTSSLKENMDQWTASLNQALSTTDISKIHGKLEEILTQQAEIYSMVEDSLTFIQLTNGELELSENNYDIREAVRIHMERLAESRTFKKFSLNCTISEDMPQILFGDSARLCQLISKLFFFASVNAKRGTLNLFIGSEKKSYASNLILQISDKSESITKEKFLNIKNYFEYGTINELSADQLKKYGLPVIKQLVKYLNGRLDINEQENNCMEFVVTIPQLAVKTGEL